MSERGLGFLFSVLVGASSLTGVGAGEMTPFVEGTSVLATLSWILDLATFPDREMSGLWVGIPGVPDGLVTPFSLVTSPLS